MQEGLWPCLSHAAHHASILEHCPGAWQVHGRRSASLLRYEAERRPLSLRLARAQDARAQLSRDLVALWADEYGPALGVLRAALPPGLMRYLNQPRPAPPPPQAPGPRADGPPSGPERVASPPPQRVLPLAAVQSRNICYMLPHSLEHGKWAVASWVAP